MSEFELTISKYLDGELTRSETVALRKLLASNPDAMREYRVMTSIRRAARRAPSLRAPLASSEIQLFQRLRREGFSGFPSPATFATPLANIRSTHGTRRRSGMIAAVLVASIVTIVGVFAPRTDAPSVQVATDTSHTTFDMPFASRSDSSSDRGALQVDAIRGGSTDAAMAGASRPALRDGRSVDRGRSAGKRHASTARPTHASTNAFASDKSVASSLGGSSESATSTDPTSPRETLAAATPPETSSPSSSVESLTAATTSAPSSPTSSVGSLAAATTSAPASSSASNEALAATTDPELDVPTLLPLPAAGIEDDPLLSASLRFGTSFIAASSARSEDLSIGVGVNFGDGHHLALLGGRSAAVTEQRAVNTHSVAARSAIADAKGGGPTLARTNEVPAPFDIEVGQEWWLGAGYNFSVEAFDRVEFGAGLRGGVGAQSLHLGGELAARYRVTQSIAIELTPSVAHVIPHDRDRSEFALESSSDGYLYDAESEYTAFSTYGVALGVRIALY